MTAPTCVLRLRSVGVTYPGPPPVTALEEVDLTIAPGEGLAIVGPSGSGKSTLLHVMGALDRPTSGHVEIDGTDVAALDDDGLSALRGAAIGFVFQQFHLLPHRTALDNVADGLLYRGTARDERRARAALALERVGLGARLGHRPAELSGGEQQRVALARALVGEPRIVLADEPTGNLDSTTEAAVLELLLGAHADGTTVVIITHDDEVAGRLPRRVSLRDGKVEHAEVAR